MEAADQSGGLRAPRPAGRCLGRAVTKAAPGPGESSPASSRPAPGAAVAVAISVVGNAPGQPRSPPVSLFLSLSLSRRCGACVSQASQQGRAEPPLCFWAPLSAPRSSAPLLPSAPAPPSPLSASISSRCHCSPQRLHLPSAPQLPSAFNSPQHPCSVSTPGFPQYPPVSLQLPISPQPPGSSQHLALLSPWVPSVLPFSPQHPHSLTVRTTLSGTWWHSWSVLHKARSLT